MGGRLRGAAGRHSLSLSSTWDPQRSHWVASKSSCLPVAVGHCVPQKEVGQAKQSLKTERQALSCVLVKGSSRLFTHRG